MADLDVLSSVLQQTQSPDLVQRRGAEEYLTNVERQPAYPQQLIRLIERHCAGTSPVDKSVRTLGAIMFKNLVKKSWVPPEDGENKENSIAEADKAAIKATMVHIMCVSPPEVQRQFSEALAIISRHDFPARWPTLLPDLVAKFNSPDFHIVLGVLLTANAVFKRFRYVYKSDELFAELKYVLEEVQAPMLALFLRTSGAVAAAANDKAQLVKIMEALRLIARIFFSLNWQDLPEFFEDRMKEWMGDFLKYLRYTNPLLLDPNEEMEPDPISKLQAAIVENVNLYGSKYEEEFQPHLPEFTQAIWALLMTVGPHQKHDVLATTCIRFLSSIVSKQIHVDLFREESTLSQILQRIALPNLALRTSDEELFEDNAVEYIQRDMEGSDNDTRRRCAADLIRSMCRHHEQLTTSLGLRQANELLQQYAAGPDANWRAKDTALQLLLALAVRAQSAAGGVSQTNTFLDVMELLTTHVLPELRTDDVASRPVVRADCMKFVTTFRSQFTPDQLSAVMPLLIAHLQSPAVVVQTYAAMAIERILTVKDRQRGQRPAARFGKERLQPFLQPLFTNLFAALDNPELAENDYIMKAVMRALSTAQESVLPVAQVVLGKLTSYVARACKNPANPQFNHFLFEAVAVLIGCACRADASGGTVDMFEAALFPPFQEVLALDVAEFTPYVFQLLAQLLEGRPGPFSPAYAALFPPLLTPALWERRGNVPALVRLLSAYVRKDAAALAAGGHVLPMLGVFQKLNASRATETPAFMLLGALVDSAPPAALAPYLPELMNLLLKRLQQNKTPKYVRLLVQLCSLVVARHGVPALSAALEACQAGVTVMLLRQVWVPLFAEPPQLDDGEVHVMSIGMTKVLCECEQVLADPELWGAFLGATVRLLAPPADAASTSKGEEVAEAEAEDEVAYDSHYSRLHFAAAEAKSYLEGLPGGAAFFAQGLQALCTSRPGTFSAIAARSLDAASAAALERLLVANGAKLS